MPAPYQHSACACAHAALHPVYPASSRDPAPPLLFGELRAGNQYAWATVVARHEPALRRDLHGYRLQPTDADDVLQTTWQRCPENLDRLRCPCALRSWLRTTARREALRNCTETARSEARAQLDDLVDEGDELDDPIPTTEMSAAVRAAVARLSSRQRLLMVASSTAPTQPGLISHGRYGCRSEASGRTGFVPSRTCALIPRCATHTSRREPLPDTETPCERTDHDPADPL